jgi:hypothetical protein
VSHPPPQDLKNHARLVPWFHLVAAPILVINLIDSIIALVHESSWNNIMGALVALALVLLLTAARTFALRVQDRVIRLEEQLRFERLFPPDLRLRIPEFTRAQFIALRYASDGELPELARTVLDQRITDQRAIKQMVTNWRADHLRA